MKGDIVRLKCSLFLLILITLGIAEQGTVTITTFLVADEKSAAIKTQKDKVNFLKKSSSNMPVIDDVEIRIRNNAYKIDEQEYSLRIEPRGFGETKASRNLYKTNLSYQKQKKKIMESKLLKNRYNRILNYMNTQSMVRLYKQLNVLYEDKIKVLKNKTASLKFNLVDIIEVENEYTKLKFNNIEREIKLNKQRDKIRKILKDEAFEDFDTLTFIDMKSINAFIEETEFELDVSNIYLTAGKLRLQLAKDKFNLETAESRRYINFFQFSYDHDNMKDEMEIRDENETKLDFLKEDYDLNKAYTFQVGFRIPFFNVDRHDINRRKLSYLSEKEDFNDLEKDLEKRIEKDAHDIKILFSQYTFLLARKNDVNAESSLKKYLELDGVDPIKLLSIRESIINNDIKIEKIKFDILKNYIRILNVSGYLYQKPIKNYLSVNLDAIR